MAVTQTVAFEILATVEKYRAGMAQMEGITAQAAAKAALRLERELVKAQVAATKAAQSAAEKSAKAHEDAAKRAGKAGEDAGKGLEKGLKAMGGPIGGAADMVVELGEAFSLLASPTGLVVGALAATALALGGVVLAAGAGVVALGQATLAADEALTALDGFKAIGSDFYPKVPPETLESIGNVNAAMDALGSIGDRLTVIIGGNVAASFEKAANVAVGLALTASETFEKFAEGKNLLEEFALLMGTSVVNALLGPLYPLGLLAQGYLALAEATGIDIPDAAEASLKAFSRLSTDSIGLARDISEGALALGAQAVAATGLGDALEGVSAKGAKFIGVQERATKAVDGAADAIARAKREAEELVKAQKLAADEAAKWGHELALLREGADLSELNDRLIAIGRAEREGAIDAVAAEELKTAARAKYAKSVADAEQKVRDEGAKTAKDEQARLKEVEAARREGLSNYQRDIEDTTAKLKQAGWDDITAGQAARMGVAWGQAAQAVTPYLDMIDAIASAELETHTAALESINEQIEEIASLISDLADTTVDAASLSGAALVDAYKAGEVAVEDLTDAQKSSLKKKLAAEKEALETKAAFEKDAADKAFATQQAVAIGNAIIAGAVGAVSAFQLGPIAGAIAAAGIAALTVTQVALIASTKPEYQHAGGVSGEGYPDEVDMRRLPGEGIINRQGVAAMGGAAGVNAINAGHSPGGVTVLRIGRHEAREIARTDIRSNGIIPQTVRSIARRSGKGAGLSGRGAIA